MGNSWKERRLGDFMNFKNGLNADKDDYGSGLKFVNVMDIFANNVLRKAAIRGSVFASAKSAHDYSVEYGDVLFNRTSETPEDIACASVYLDSEPITFGGFVLRGRQRKQVLDPNFSAYAFQAEDVRRELIRRGPRSRSRKYWPTRLGKSSNSGAPTPRTTPHRRNPPDMG